MTKETFTEHDLREQERIQSGIEQETARGSQKDELFSLASRLGKALGTSRLEASVVALRFATQGIKDWPLLMGSICPEDVKKDVIGFSEYPSAATICKVAKDLGDYGFTLDMLIEAAGPDIVVRPKAYKNQLSRLLRQYGFFQKQVRQHGKRPLLWFHPDRCGISM